MFAQKIIEKEAMHIKFFHFDPRKWLIYSLSKLGLASHLKRVSDEEIMKAKLTVKVSNIKGDVDTSILADIEKSILDKIQYAKRLSSKFRKKQLIEEIENEIQSMDKILRSKLVSI